MKLEQLINKHYRQMFDALMDEYGDDMFDLTLEVKLLNGITIKRKWTDRNTRLQEGK